MLTFAWLLSEKPPPWGMFQLSKCCGLPYTGLLFRRNNVVMSVGLHAAAAQALGPKSASLEAGGVMAGTQR